METIKDISPNHTQVPNIYLDMYMADLTGAEWKCLCYIARRTFGFQKRTDSIATSQFENGIRDSKGNILDKGTGLTNKPIIKALDNLVNLGLISVVKDEPGITKAYRINIKLLTYGKSPQVTHKEPMEKVHSTYGETPQEPMEKVHIQKKEKESIQKKDIFSGKPSNNVSEIIKLFESVDAKNKTYYANKGQRMACQFMIDEYGFDRVCKVIELLPNTNQLDYFPRITSPYELKEKWTKLATALQSKKRNEDFSSIML